MRLSVLDLAPICAGGDAAAAFRNSVSLAQHAESLGYHRYWVAEHHNIASVASSATSVVIAHIAAHTKTIRVGSGGIMLPNHAPLQIAEQFGTLESLYPGRIDLGIGRAPGGDQLTARALRRGLGSSGESMPQDLDELRAYFHPSESMPSPVRAIPGFGLNVPIYLLGSSDFSAVLAAKLGLPFAFASHFAPDSMHEALLLYRRLYQPSEEHPQPYVIVGANIFAAESDAEGRRLFTSLQQAFLNLVRGRPAELAPPVDSMDGRWSYSEQSHVDRMTRVSAIGSPETVRQALQRIQETTQADELILTGQIFDHQSRLKSFEIAVSVFAEQSH
jgi:luciferase family oxidoreductase group 1